MGRAIEVDNRLDDHQKRIQVLEGVVAELSNALINTKQTKHVDMHDALEEHERKIRQENNKTYKPKRKARKTAEAE